MGADGCCRLRLSGCVFRDTEAVSSVFFDNPIKLQPAGAHINAHIISVAFEIEFPSGRAACLTGSEGTDAEVCGFVLLRWTRSVATNHTGGELCNCAAGRSKSWAEHGCDWVA